MSKALLLMRMSLGWPSTITVWILLLQARWQIESVQAAAQLQISHCLDGMHQLDGWSRICRVGGYFSCTLEGGRMGDNLECFERFWVSFWCFVYFIITLVIFMHEGLCREFMMLGLIIQKGVFGQGIVAVEWLHVWLSCNWWFGIFSQKQSTQTVSETRNCFSSLQ